MDDFSQKIEVLAFQVQEKIGKPLGINVVQAIIESFGIREIDVKEDYDVISMQELAKIVYEKLLIRTQNHITVSDNGLNYKITFQDFKVFLKSFFIGIFYVFPIFFQVLCVVLFGYSLWVNSKFNILQSTSVVLGVITSLIVTGGIITVISKQISFFWNYKNFKMLFQYSVYLVYYGIKVLVIFNMLLILASVLLGFFSFEMAVISTAYSILIGAVLLLIAPLYVYKQRNHISLSIIAGSILSLVLKFYTVIPVYFTHWIGIFSVMVLLSLFLINYFKKHNVLNWDFSFNEIKKEFLIYHNYTYFFYGSLFFLFVFLDRIIAWSAQEKHRFSYFIFFEKDYEIGMDIALLTYLLVAGVFEYSVTDFAKQMDLLQSKIRLNQIENYGKIFFKRYYRNVFLLFFTSILAFLIQIFLLFSKYGYNAYFEEKLNLINIRVCIIGSLGYFFFSWAILNVLYFFTLGQPLKSLKGLLIALLVNLVLGLFFSRFFSYDLSVVGFLLGSIVFMIYSTIQLKIFFKKLDYYYYAAF